MIWHFFLENKPVIIFSTEYVVCEVEISQSDMEGLGTFHIQHMNICVCIILSSGERTFGTCADIFYPFTITIVWGIYNSIENFR